MTTRVSLAELAAADIQLRPAEAVAIVSEICRRCDTGLLRGVPPLGVIRLTRDGNVIVEGPVTTGDDILMAAHLLSDLLAGTDATPEYRASGALQLVIARGLGTLDLPPYGSLAEFCRALHRFATIDVTEAARALFEAWERARGEHDLLRRDRDALTISDIRRARRATGLTLQDLAVVAEVPARQLRHFEWGDMRQWRDDPDGRAQVVRYARAAGLDEGLVLSIAWPMIEEQAATAPAPIIRSVALVPSGPQRLLVSPSPRPAPARVHYRGWIAAAIAAVLLAVVTALALARIDPGPTPRVGERPPQAVDIGIAATGTAPALVAPDGAPAAAGVPQRGTPASSAVPQRAVPASVAVPQRATPPRPRPRRIQKPQTEHKRNVFERELIRFVFK